MVVGFLFCLKSLISGLATLFVFLKTKTANKKILIYLDQEALLP